MPTELEFPTTPGSLIRATAGADPDQILFIRVSTEPDPSPHWISSDGAWYSEANLRLHAVVHDEGRVQMLANLPAWGELSDVDKGAALMYVWKVENEGHEYAVENYPPKFVEHETLKMLRPHEAADYVDGFGFDLQWGAEVTWDGGEMSWDEFHRLYDLAADAK